MTIARDWIFITKPRMVDIAERVAAENRMALAELRSDCRLRRVAWPRQNAMAEMHRYGYSHHQIVRFFGLKNHTTSVHAKQAVAERGGLRREAA